MAEKALITRRAALLGALTASAALAVPAVAAVTADGTPLTHQIIGAYYTLSNGKRVDCCRVLREQGMGDIAAALETIPPHRAGTLEELTRQFIADARAVDPTIKAVWIGNDQLPAHRGEIFNVTFDRRRQLRRKRT